MTSQKHFSFHQHADPGTSARLRWTTNSLTFWRHFRIQSWRCLRGHGEFGIWMMNMGWPIFWVGSMVVSGSLFVVSKCSDFREQEFWGGLKPTRIQFRGLTWDDLSSYLESNLCISSPLLPWYTGDRLGRGSLGGQLFRGSLRTGSGWFPWTGQWLFRPIKSYKHVV